jgi:co-chaperonin GroES (HSP10)
MLTLNKNNIAVVPVFDSDKTEGGLWIPDVAKKRANQGVVKYIGKDVKDISVGDYVLFSGYTGTTVRLGGGEGVVIILHKDFVNAKILLTDAVIVPGLFFQDRNPIMGVESAYFPATYEQAVPLLAAALQDIGQKLNIKTDKPAIEDYNAKSE